MRIGTADLVVGVDARLFSEIRESGVPQAEIDKVILDHFTGKRSAPRICRFVDVLVEGRHGSFRALAVDLSRTGMLFRILDRGFAAEADSCSLMPYMARVGFHFEGGFWVCFPDHGFGVEADVVRVSGDYSPGEGVLLIGCRFRRELTPDRCAALGVEQGGDRGPVADSF